MHGATVLRHVNSPSMPPAHPKEPGPLQNHPSEKIPVQTCRREFLVINRGDPGWKLRPGQNPRSQTVHPVHRYPIRDQMPKTDTEPVIPVTRSSPATCPLACALIGSSLTTSRYSLCASQNSKREGPSSFQPLHPLLSSLPILLRGDRTIFTPLFKSKHSYPQVSIFL